MKLTKEVLISTLILFIALIFQSTVVQFIAIGGAIPDLSLILLVFISIRRGRKVGQFSGFFSGLIEDFLSPTPVGFYALIKTIIGYLYGLFMGRMFMGSIIVPVFLVLAATVIKYILGALVVLLIPSISGNMDFFSVKMLFEILYNCLLAIPLYKFISLFKIFKLNEKETG